MPRKTVPVLGNDYEVVEYLEFSVEEYQDRLRRLREAAGGSYDAIVLTSPENLRYFSGYRSLITRSRWRALFLVVPIDDAVEPVLVLPEQEIGLGLAATWIDDLVVARESVRNGHDDLVEVAAGVVRRLGLETRRLGGEYGFAQRLGMTWDEQVRFRAELPDATFMDGSAAIWATRAVKSPAEVDLLRSACEISCEGVRAGFAELRAGMSEREVHRIMLETMAGQGADEVWLAFSSGAKGYGVSNAFPSDEPLRDGHFIWVDGGAYVQGYVCDFIRSAVVGEPSADQLRWFNAALASTQAGVATLAPGRTGADAFAAAREQIEGAGVASGWGLDVLGHGVGLEIHELPSLKEDSRTPLEVGNVVTIEPSLSPPNHEHGHYIVEEVVAVTPDGHDVLTSSLSPELWVA